MISGDVAETAANTFVCFRCRPSHRPAFILLSVMSRASRASSLLSKAHVLLLPGHQALSGAGLQQPAFTLMEVLLHVHSFCAIRLCFCSG